MVKDMYVALLFDFYHNLLTDKQANAIDLYYNNDLSLAEISEHLCITRQGVRDIIKRAEVIMAAAEGNLGLASRYAAVINAAEGIAREVDELERADNALLTPRFAPRLRRIREHLRVISESE